MKKVETKFSETVWVEHTLVGDEIKTTIFFHKDGQVHSKPIEEADKGKLIKFIRSVKTPVLCQAIWKYYKFLANTRTGEDFDLLQKQGNAYWAIEKEIQWAKGAVTKEQREKVLEEIQMVLFGELVTA